MTHQNINNKALLLFISMALVRLAGQFLGIHMLSALALVIDVYALGLLLGVEQRQRALSPVWLALLFAFSLPLERIIQRILGFPLQLISAEGSCSLLSLFNDSMQCNGVEMILNQQVVLVDLPCSGTRSLIHLFILFTLMSCLRRPASQLSTMRYLFSGLMLLMLSAYLGNVLRISILAIGIAYPGFVFDIDVMSSPWHDTIGLITLGLSTLPILIFNTRFNTRFNTTSQARAKTYTFIKKNGLVNCHKKSVQKSQWLKFLPIISPLIVIMAVLITIIPAHPIDVVKTTHHIDMPNYLNGYYAAEQAITAQEQLYFTQYGGNAHKVSYGDFSVLQVSTRAPLRHLHAPHECLTGSGHQVQYLGYSQTPLNAAVYKSTDPQGNVWRISVTFMSSYGQQTTNIAQAIWLWFKQPDSRWTMLQRITAWNTPQQELIIWDQALIQALELNSSVPQMTTGESDHAII